MGVVMMIAGEAVAETAFEDFSGDATRRWDFVADGVMGGVSQGRAEIAGTAPDAVMRLSGTVSTDNDGGFIQVRRRFNQTWPDTAKGLTVTAKGNGAQYYVFLKTAKLSRVWHSYRLPFVAEEEWRTHKLPFEMFSPSHMGMPAMFTPDQVTSIAVVAYGDDFKADVLVKDISLY